MIIKIRVKSNSDKQEIIRVSENEYKIALKEKPEDNKANLELLKMLRKHFNVEANHIKLIKGLKSRDKIVEVG